MGNLGVEQDMSRSAPTGSGDPLDTHIYSKKRLQTLSKTTRKSWES